MVCSTTSIISAYLPFSSYLVLFVTVLLTVVNADACVPDSTHFLKSLQTIFVGALGICLKSCGLGSLVSVDVTAWKGLFLVAIMFCFVCFFMITCRSWKNGMVVGHLETVVKLRFIGEEPQWSTSIYKLTIRPYSCRRGPLRWNCSKNN